MTKAEYDKEQEDLLEAQTSHIEYCGYCQERMFWYDEHDDMEVCHRCLVKVPDEELEEAGLL